MGKAVEKQQHANICMYELKFDAAAAAGGAKNFIYLGQRLSGQQPSIIITELPRRHGVRTIIAQSLSSERFHHGALFFSTSNSSCTVRKQNPHINVAPFLLVTYSPYMSRPVWTTPLLKSVRSYSRRRR